jgi:Rrf2 family nitric oxide-sensitive transcriptional repressor
MRLTAYTDYTLRTLMYLAYNQGRLVTINEIANTHGISKNNLMKVAHQLGVNGLVDTVRGRNGGLRLNKSPDKINIRDVVSQTESDFFMAECFSPNNNACLYDPGCRLKSVLNSATKAYMAVLSGVTLNDITRKGQRQGTSDQPIANIKIYSRASKKIGSK